MPHTRPLTRDLKPAFDPVQLPRDATASPTEVVLKVDGATKSFGANKALIGASLELRGGAIHALLGGNGSGKSTLLKALAGVQPADTGILVVAGKTLELNAMTPAKARDLGLRFVHQQPSTFEDLTVAENLAIGGSGFDLTVGWRVRWRRTRQHAQEILDRFEIAAHPDDELSGLNPATRTMIAIARALHDQEDASDGILLLDEPTASLPDHEATLLLDALRRYAAHGQTIVYVTHRLEEVFAAADQATLLSDGRVLGTVVPSTLTHGDLVELIMGRAVEQVSKPVASETREVVLEALQISAGPLEELSLVAHAGEIVGVAGLIGSGRSSLLKVLFGALQRRSGSIKVDGESVDVRSVEDAISAGMCFVPEDRGRDAAFSELSLRENLSIASMSQHWQGLRIRPKSEDRVARQLLNDFAIKADSLDVPMSALSGGNQQKAILARWLQRQPRVLLLDEPTQGVDVGARAEIYRHIRRAVDAGNTALVASSDTEELATICDRVIVLHKGRKVAEVAGEDLTSEQLQRLSHQNNVEGEDR